MRHQRPDPEASLRIRCSKSELEAWHAKASKAQMTLSDYMRAGLGGHRRNRHCGATKMHIPPEFSVPQKGAKSMTIAQLSKHLPDTMDSRTRSILLTHFWDPPTRNGTLAQSQPRSQCRPRRNPE